MNLNHIKCYAFMLFLIKKERKSSFLFGILLPQHTCMIILYYENNNTFTQDTYDNIIDQTDLMTLKCPAVNILDVLSDMQDILELLECPILR